jgi:hypothetical protein
MPFSLKWKNQNFFYKIDFDTEDINLDSKFMVFRSNSSNGDWYVYRLSSEDNNYTYEIKYHLEKLINFAIKYNAVESFIEQLKEEQIKEIVLYLYLYMVENNIEVEDNTLNDFFNSITGPVDILSVILKFI